MSSKPRKARTPAQAVYYARLQIARINEWTAALNLDQFQNDQRTRYAVERAFIALGEAIKDLAKGVDLPTLDPTGPWSGPARFRDFLAHQYDDQVIPTLMWNTIRTDLRRSTLRLRGSKARSAGPTIRTNRRT
jgi:uncharacterized protein with HEPN domain